MSRRTALLLLATLTAAAVALDGCASMLPKLQPPTLTVTAISFAGGNPQQQRMHLTLHIVNPNAREIAVRGIDCKVDLEDQPFAEGSTDAAFTLPASGETDFGLNVSANLNSALLALASGLNHSTVDYHLYGQVHLSGIVRTIPFDQKGRVRL
jgi:LEA14-like dessication related protein